MRSLLRLGAERALLLHHLLLLLAQLLVDLGALGWLVAVLSGLWGWVSVVWHGKRVAVSYRTGSVNLGLLYLLALGLRLALLLRLRSKLVGDGLLVLWNMRQ